jgi:hypothetical protein
MKRNLLLALFAFVFSLSSFATGITVTDSIVNSCNGGAIPGQVILTAQGGTAPYEYKEGTGSYQSSNVFTGLAQGPYTFYAKDANGATASVVAVVLQSPTPTITPTITNVTNTTNYNGAISVSVSGGVAPYSYEWLGFEFTPGNVYNDTTGIGGLNPGSYYMWVTDHNGCRTADSFVVTGGGNLSFTYRIKSPSCYANPNDDTIVLVGSGGTPIVFGGNSFYLYGSNFIGWTDDSVYHLSGSGLWFFTIQDNNDAQYSSYFHINEPTPLIASGTVNNASGAGQSNGSISLIVSGGQLPYRYAWAHSSNTTASLTGLSSGTYTVTVTEAGGCSSVKSFIVGPPSLSDTVINVRCYNFTDGSVNLGVVGAYEPYQFSQDGALYQSGNQFSNLSFGSYTFYVRDSTGATDSVAVMITEPTPISVSGSVTNSSSTFNDGSISLLISGGTAPYSCMWIQGTSSSSTNITNLAPGFYQVVITDANGCATADTFTVGVLAGIIGIKGNTGLNIYPNPNKGSFILQSTDAAGKEYIISDMLGRVVAQQKITSNNQNIELQNISTGSYTIQIKGSEKNAVRFVIEN